MGTPLGPKYIPYTYMDPLGVSKAEILCPIGGYASVPVPALHGSRRDCLVYRPL